MNNDKPPLIGGKTVKEWDLEWSPVVGGLKQYHPDLRRKVGLWRLLLNGVIVAVGIGTEIPAGIAKRLSDFRRASDSGRKHFAGERIGENLERLRVEVLITGSDRLAQEIARALKTPMMMLHKPVWSVFNAPYTRKG